MNLLAEQSVQHLRERLARLYGEALAPRLTRRLLVLLQRYQVALGEVRRPGDRLWDQSDTLLITYADTINAPQESPLVTLRRFYEHRLREAIGIVHLLPFFPYSSDDGFSVIDYRAVRPELGGWPAVEALGQRVDLMFDLVLNHVSAQSRWFQHYVNGIAPFRDYFIEADPEDPRLAEVVRPRTTPLLTPVQTPCGERRVWTTFSADQVDFDYRNQDVLFEMLEILLLYVHHGARIVRLDAVAYLWKELGTPCINLPQTHEVVKLFRDVLDLLAPDVLLITETNLPHAQNVSYFGQGDEANLVYQFSLPPLLLHALQRGSAATLREWVASLGEPPPGCSYLNFTASHDGIGVRPLEGLVPDAELAALVEGVERRGGRVSRFRRPDGSERAYELNITYYDALGEPGQVDSDEHVARFLCSQTVMLALRGVPAVYLHALTATHNDYAGVERTGHARAINRRRWGEQELEGLLADPATAAHRVFHEYVRRLALRRARPALHPDGPQRVLDLPEGLLGIEREAPDGSERLLCISNLAAGTRELTLPGGGDGYHELLSDRVVQRGGRRQRLRPYQSLWLLSR